MERNQDRGKGEEGGVHAFSSELGTLLTGGGLCREICEKWKVEFYGFYVIPVPFGKHPKHHKYVPGLSTVGSTSSPF